VVVPQGPHLTSGGDNDNPNADRWILLEGLCRSMGSPVEPAAVEHWYAELEEISAISEILIVTQHVTVAAAKTFQEFRQKLNNENLINVSI